MPCRNNDGRRRRKSRRQANNINAHFPVKVVLAVRNKLQALAAAGWDLRMHPVHRHTEVWSRRVPVRLGTRITHSAKPASVGSDNLAGRSRLMPFPGETSLGFRQSTRTTLIRQNVRKSWCCAFIQRDGYSQVSPRSTHSRTPEMANVSAYKDDSAGSSGNRLE